MYSDDEDYKGFLDIKNRLEHEFMDDIPENAKHNQKIGILSYVVRINEIIYHNFKDTEYYVNIYPHKLDEYDGNLNVLLKTIEEYYYEIFDKRKLHVQEIVEQHNKDMMNMPLKPPKKELTHEQIKERELLDELNEKHIQEHIEFNKKHGIYNDEHIKEEEEVYNTGIKIPYLISKKSKQKNKPPTVYINYMYDNTGISSSCRLWHS
jgi:small nuclear ribonucleoprotein (snRNP)-like protein